ncbi:hypothetical protein OsJ_00050 [Oryza sativa Japonica Group]|uniref:Uncharacterized protein n=1 Tax=Oryza sativa subsp. japonica TaxID=39947 RepID=A2ZNC3_ORYSJ|nr:hypothetical protein OsJ_00050 [Oryza sativa Japonica Group]
MGKAAVRTGTVATRMGTGRRRHGWGMGTAATGTGTAAAADMVGADGMFFYADADGAAERAALPPTHVGAVPVASRAGTTHLIADPHLHPPRRPPPRVPRRRPLCLPPATPHHFTTLVASVARTASSAPLSSPSPSRPRRADGCWRGGGDEDEEPAATDSQLRPVAAATLHRRRLDGDRSPFFFPLQSQQND